MQLSTWNNATTRVTHYHHICFFQKFLQIWLKKLIAFTQGTFRKPANSNYSPAKFVLKKSQVLQIWHSFSKTNAKTKTWWSTQYPITAEYHQKLHSSSMLKIIVQKLGFFLIDWCPTIFLTKFAYQTLCKGCCEINHDLEWRRSKP